MSTMTKKSMLARLLAQENITVESGNHETAWFDPARRVLALPAWDDMSKDLYDLLVGHEVSHALETPADGWHDADTLIPGCPRAFLNVTEDVRIEKLILRRYPGLIANFRRGYKELLDRDFFGIAGKDVNSLSFMNRLNIKAKVRDLLDVEFSEKEMYFVNKTYAAETWDDTIEVTREIYKWLKKQEKKTRQRDTDIVWFPGSFDGDKVEVDFVPEPEELKEQKEDKPKNDYIPEDLAEPVGSEDGFDENDFIEELDLDDDDDDDGDSDLAKVETDTEFRSRARSLSNNYRAGGKAVYIQDVTEEQKEALTVPFAAIQTERNKIQLDNRKILDSKYQDFMTEQKPIISSMIKEFEMKKSAYRQARARTSSKGSLDVNKLHSYKFNDQIFKQYTTLADSKNHGLIMLVDYSGSMHSILPRVIKQVVVLSLFCKRANIPFTVYGFNTPGKETTDKIRSKTNDMVVGINFMSTRLIELVSSDLSKSEFDQALRWLYYQTVDRHCNTFYEYLGSTPLNTALIAMHKLINDFKRKHNVQKMVFLTLTDGDSDPLTYSAKGRGEDYSTIAASTRVSYIQLNGKYIELPRGYGQSTTSALLKSIGEMGVTTANFFIGDTKDAQRALNYTNYEEAKKLLGTEGFYVAHDNMGYDRRIFINSKKSNILDTSVGELDIGDASTGSSLGRKFSSHNKNKKSARIVAQKFAEMIA